jgi:hypothetical protein
MKKRLLCSCAALALAATGASAQEWSATVGGFLTGAVGYVDVDQDGNDFALIRDGEVHFNFDLVADNGLTFGARVQLEMGDDTDNGNVIDEAYGFVAGSFGRVEFGEQDGAADDPMAIGSVGADFVRAGDEVGLLFDYYASDAGVTLLGTGTGTSDSLKLSYYTPEFAGFSAGISWTPSIGAENGTATSLASSAEQNAIELGAQWAGEFGGFSIAAGGGWVSDTEAGLEDDSTYGGGVAIGFSGVEFGVNYAHVEIDDIDTLAVGAAYSTGPWKLGADYAVALSSDDATIEDDMGVAAGVSYALAPGVVSGVTFEYADDGASGGDDSFAAGLWLSLGF